MNFYKLRTVFKLNVFGKILIIIFMFGFLSCGSDNETSPETEKELSTVILISVEIIDGTIFLKWNPIKNLNFTKATLTINRINRFESIELSKEDLISQVYNDKYSVDKELEYAIILEYETRTTTSNKLRLITEEISVSQELLDIDKIKVTYSKHPIYKNIDYFEYEMYPLKKQISPLGGEFIIDFEFVFGEKNRLNNYKHLFTPFKNEDVYGQTYTKSFDIGKSFDKGLCIEYLYDATQNMYLGIQQKAITIANKTLLEIYIYELSNNDLSTLKTKLVVTSEDSFVDIAFQSISSNNIVLNLSNKAYLLNRNDFEIIKEWDINDYNNSLPANHSMYYRNGIVALDDTYGKVYIYDAETKVLLYSGTKYNFYFNISDDGRYFYNDDGIYAINNGTVNLITSTNYKSSVGYVMNVDFLLDENKCVYTGSYNNPTILDINTGTKKVLTHIADAQFVQYDIITKSIAFGEFHVTNNKYQHGSFITVYNINNEKSKRLHVYDFHTIGFFYRYLNNKLIFSGNLGQYLDGYFN